MQHLTDKTRHLAHAAQRGAILIPAVAALLVCVVLLGAAQLGLYFSVKRDLQNVVDLAALNNVVLLDNVEQLEGYEDNPREVCEAAMLGYVSDYISSRSDFNTRLDEDESALVVSCERVNVVEDKEDGVISYHGEPLGVTGSFSAIGVTFTLKAKDYAFFGSLGLENISASSTAYLPPIDEFLEQQRFSVNYDTLGINNSGLLSLLLKQVGLNTEQVSVLTHNGLANVKLTPSGLLQELDLPVGLDLDVATSGDLLDLHDFRIAELLQASATVLGQQDLADVSVTALSSAIQALANLPGFSTSVPLFGTSGFLNIADNGNSKAALATVIDWGDFLNTAISIAQNNTGIELKPTVGLGSLLTIDSAVRLIEPPATAPLIKGAKANHANVRVYLRAKLNLLLLEVDLPISIELGQGAATLLEEPTYDRATAQGEAIFEVKGSLANLCIGDPGVIFSRINSCADEELVFPHKFVKVLNSGTKTAGLKIPILADSTGSNEPVIVTLVAGKPSVSEPVQTLKLNLHEIVKQVLGETIGKILGGILDVKSDLPSRESNFTALSNNLISEYGSLNRFNNAIETTAETLNTYDVTNQPPSLVEFLTSIVSFAGDLLKNLLDLLSNLLCIFCSDQTKLSKILVADGDGGVSILALTVLNQLLEPLENRLLNPLLENLLKTLGLDVGEVTVRVDEFFSSDNFEGILIHIESSD
ncbi:hypothetical protein L1889_09960 [Paenalcaligenes niemegkensis]|uniref:hypothetical protein n=1 Tax=Paenalcaligenes niemegkensis TaxID=2895469 RepID=UPI001EE7C736|nr:hypothetical protein [Paenalcaligenes niemegkensis]MCQ9616984.1 hypothetical protein [Paenalcaligenes niemegkensis]